MAFFYLYYSQDQYAEDSVEMRSLVLFNNKTDIASKFSTFLFLLYFYPKSNIVHIVVIVSV